MATGDPPRSPEADATAESGRAGTSRRGGGAPPGSRRRPLLFWVVALAVWGLAAGSAGTLPYRFARVGGPLPADFARDFIVASVRPVSGAVYDPAPELARWHLALLGLTEGPTGGPFYAHPPAAALLVAPLVPLGFRAAALTWLALSIGLVAVLATVLADVLTDARGVRRGIAAALAFVFVALWPPVLYNIEKGQWSLMLAALMALGWRGLAAGRPGWAGASMGLACLFKLAPATVLPYLAFRRPRAAVAFVATIAALAVGSVAAVGLEPWRAFYRQAPANVAFWQDRLENAVSVMSLITKLLVEGRHTRPLLDAPMTAGLLTGLVTAALVGASVLLTWRARAETGSAVDGALFALWCALGALLNPLAWLHSSILLLLPAALVLRALADPALPVRGSARLACEATVVVGVALLSLPKETLYYLAWPVPVAPGRVLAVIGLPCYGALAIFGAAAFVAGRGAPGAPRSR